MPKTIVDAVRDGLLDAELAGRLWVLVDGGVPVIVSGGAATDVAGRRAIRTDLATSSIVLTLTTNFSEVKRVQFLSEGEELTLLTGGVDLRKPLQPRFPGEEAQPLGSQPREAE